MTKFYDWVCGDCGHEVVSTGQPAPIRWADCHVCTFIRAESDSQPAIVYEYDCSREKWIEFEKAMGSGARFEIDKKMFYYFLEVLPPIYMNQLVILPGGQEVLASFGFAEGAENITAFWRDNGRYFGQRTEKINHL